MALGLLKPESFKDDPYGYLTNQISHMFLGFSLLTYYCFFVGSVVGWPNQTLAVITITLLYLFGWEFFVQGWRGWDTLEDSLFVFLGAASFLSIDYEVVINRVVFFVTFVWLFLSFGVIRRLKCQMRTYKKD